ncbi:MAG: sigma-70 family RNA polymerase sigma factor [Anaerolineae bacterium]|nr:sigma-70 family RNA polymerase sigma factor [Anaerolineae bacterium]
MEERKRTTVTGAGPILDLLSGAKPDRTWADARLVEACQQGDERAWEALVEKYKQLIYGIPFRYGAQADDAADIFQAVWVDLYAELPRLRNVDGLKSWLMTVTARHALRWKQRRGRRGEVDLDEEHSATLDEDAPLASEILEETEQRQLVRQAVFSLPERCREMVQMLFLSDPPIPYQEVAEHFGLALGSIGFIRGRCLQKLRKACEELGIGRP